MRKVKQVVGPASTRAVSRGPHVQKSRTLVREGRGRQPRHVILFLGKRRRGYGVVRWGGKNLILLLLRIRRISWCLNLHWEAHVNYVIFNSIFLFFLVLQQVATMTLCNCVASRIFLFRIFLVFIFKDIFIIIFFKKNIIFMSSVGKLKMLKVSRSIPSFLF